jgi:HK97 gp10 family phage protein
VAKVKFDTGQRYSAHILRHVERNMLRAVNDLRNYIVKRLSVGQPPSKPFGFPHLDTGRLRGSIVAETELVRSTVVGRVGTNVEYAKALEFGTTRMKPRPFLRPSLRINKRKIRATLARPVRTSKNFT